jgi:tRNA threonylcarbamoyladenosine modification (KEOPS) complex Cgi121 subunit
VFREGLLISPRVAIAAVARTERVKRRSKPIARKPSIELLLRILGERNISEVLKKIGSIDDGEKNIVVINCTGCVTNGLKSMLKSISPDEETMKNGLKGIARLCLEKETGYGDSGETLEDLEKLVISCGISLEFEE